MHEKLIDVPKKPRSLPLRAVLFQANPLASGPALEIADALSCIVRSAGSVALFWLGAEVGATLKGHPPGTVTALILRGIEEMMSSGKNGSGKPKK